MIRRPPRSTQSRSSAASDVYKRQLQWLPQISPGPCLGTFSSPMTWSLKKVLNQSLPIGTTSSYSMLKPPAVLGQDRLHDSIGAVSRVVQLDVLLCASKRRVFSGRVYRITFLDVGQHGSVVDRATLTLKLGDSPPGANIRVRSNEHLQESLGKNRRSYVPANHDNILEQGDPSQLPVHCCPHLWHRTDRRHEAVYSRVVEGQLKNAPVKQNRTTGLVAYMTLEDIQQAITPQTTVRWKLFGICSGEHPVQQPRVNEHETELVGHPETHRRLAGSRRPVDGNITSHRTSSANAAARSTEEILPSRSMDHDPAVNLTTVDGRPSGRRRLSRIRSACSSNAAAPGASRLSMTLSPLSFRLVCAIRRPPASKRRISVWRGIRKPMLDASGWGKGCVWRPLPTTSTTMVSAPGQNALARRWPVARAAGSSHGSTRPILGTKTGNGLATSRCFAANTLATEDMHAALQPMP